MLRRDDFRDRRNYVIALASEVMAPVLRRWGRAASRGEASSPRMWRSGLIVGNGHMGDVLYRTCSLDALTAGLPECRWSYLTTPMGAELLRANPAVHEILPWMTGSTPASVDDTHVRMLRARTYDVVLCTESVQHHTALRLALRMGIPNRVAFVHKGLSGLVTHPVYLSSSMSRPAQFRAMVAQVTETAIAGELRPRVYPSPADYQAAASEWHRLGYTSTSRVLACALTTRQTIGHIPMDFFIDVLRLVRAEDSGLNIVLCGTLEDAATLRPIADTIDPTVRLSVGQLSPLAYAAFLERCCVFLGSDSGPRHLANAARIPVVFVRNLGTSAIETGTYAATEWDAAPQGAFLSDVEIAMRMAHVDRAAVARRILEYS